MVVALWSVDVNLIDRLIVMVNCPCVPEVSPTQPSCVICLMCSWLCFASILLRNFASVLIKGIGLDFWPKWRCR